MNKMGLYIQPPGEGLDLVQKYLPRAVMLMDAKGEQIRAVREVSPLTDILVWWHEGHRHWSTTDPVWWADRIAAGFGSDKPDVVAYWNEDLSHDAVPQFPDYDARQAAYIDRMQGHHGIPVGGFAMGEGNFTIDGPNLAEHFPKSLERLQYIFIHEYWFPRLHTDGMIGYHCMRWPYWLKWLDAAGYDKIQVYVSECGLTSLINEAGPDEGWLGKTAKRYGVTDQNYRDDLSQYHAYCCQEPRIRAVIPFLADNYRGNQWETFRLRSNMWLLDQTMIFDAPEDIPYPPDPAPDPDPDPEPPDGGDEMSLEDIRVFEWRKDLEKHVELETLAEKERLICQKYGAKFRRAEVAAGQRVYRLTELWEKTGHSSLISRILNEAGEAMEKVDVAFNWPDAPKPAVVYENDWYHNFVHGLTNVNGDIGPGMGPGAYHGEGEGGPHAVWVRDPNIPSDVCEKLGMLAGTNHDHLDQKFQLMVHEGEPPPPPPPPPPPTDLTPTFVRTIEQTWPTTMLCIAVILDSDDAKAWTFDTRALVTGPGVYDIVHPEEQKWTYPETGEKCSLAGGCCDYGSDAPDETRGYQVSLIRLKEGGHDELIAPHDAIVRPMDQEIKRRVIHVYRLVAGEPPPPPIDDDDAVLLIVQEMHARLQKAGRALAGD